MSRLPSKPRFPKTETLPCNTACVPPKWGPLSEAQRTQGTVSKWHHGVLKPTKPQLRSYWMVREWTFQKPWRRFVCPALVIHREAVKRSCREWKFSELRPHDRGSKVDSLAFDHDLVYLVLVVMSISQLGCLVFEPFNAGWKITMNSIKHVSWKLKGRLKKNPFQLYIHMYTYT